MEVKQLAQNMKEEAEKHEFVDMLNLGKRKMWYSRTFILFAMLEWMRGRETSFLCRYSRKNNRRNLNCGKVDILLKYLGIQTNEEKANNQKPKDAFGFFSERKNYRIYCSCAIIDWNKMPVKFISYAIGERVKQQKEMIENEYYEKYTIDYIPALDFDGDQDFKFESDRDIKVKLDISQEDAIYRSLSDLKEVIEIFNEYKIGWWVQYSGTKGFHLFFYIPLKINYERKIELSNRIKKSLYNSLDLKTIDRYPDQLRKVFKCPYSLETYNGVTRVILPLDDEQIKNFDLNKTEVSWVLHNIRNIKTRGLIKRNSDIPEFERIEGFKRLCTDFDISLNFSEEKNI